jgi:hypothetical protein
MQDQTIAHGNAKKVEASKIPIARDCLCKIIVRILTLADEKGLESVSSKSKGTSLDEYIDRVKYSGKAC